MTLWKSIKWVSLGVASLSLILAMVLMGLSGPEQMQTSSTTDNDKATSNTQVESPVIIERKDGNIIWQLRAEDAEQQLNGSMQLHMPRLILYTESKKEITIISQQAWFNPITRNLRFQDKVLVQHSVWSLRTDTLLYNSQSDELLVPNAFKLWGKSIKAKGKNMQLHRQTEQITVNDGIWIEDSEPKWKGVTP